MENLYDILQVSEKASDEVIEKVYKTLAKKYHPDVAKSKAEAENMMKKINGAYEILGNKEKRAEYDFQLQQQRASEENERNNRYNDSGTTEMSQPYGIYARPNTAYYNANTNQQTYPEKDPDYSSYYDYINKFSFSRIKNIDADSKKILGIIGIVLIICVGVFIKTINDLFNKSNNENLNNNNSTTQKKETPQKQETPVQTTPVIYDDVPKQMVEDLLKAIIDFDVEGINKNITDKQFLTEEEITIINENIDFYRILTSGMNIQYAGSDIKIDSATVTYKVSNVKMESVFTDFYLSTYEDSASVKSVLISCYNNNLTNRKTEEMTFKLSKINGEWKILLKQTDVLELVGTKYSNLINIFKKF